MGYSIISIEKIKSFAKLEGKYKHNLRINSPANADPNLTYKNVQLVDENKTNYKDKWTEAIQHAKDAGIQKKTIRKDAVLAVEVIMEFSLEEGDQMPDVESWAKDSIAWLDKRFSMDGVPTQNVISATLHMDESVPHIHAIVVPIAEEGLSFSNFVHGRRDVAMLHDEYNEAVKKYGLKRGRAFSTANHGNIKKWYTTKLNPAVNDEMFPDPMENESIGDYAKRVKEFNTDKNISHLHEMERKENEIINVNTQMRRLRFEMLEKEKALQREKEEYDEKLRKINEILKNSDKTLSEADLHPREVERRLNWVTCVLDGIRHMENRAEADALLTKINGIANDEYKKKKKKLKKEKQKMQEKDIE